LLRTGADLALDEATPAALVDPGEAVLGLSAWDGADAPRMLPRDAAFASQLGAMDRADAGHAGVDGILSALCGTHAGGVALADTGPVNTQAPSPGQLRDAAARPVSALAAHDDPEYRLAVLKRLSRRLGEDHYPMFLRLLGVV